MMSNSSTSPHLYEIQRFLDMEERKQDNCGFKHVGYVHHPFSSEQEAVEYYNDRRQAMRPLCFNFVAVGVKHWYSDWHPDTRHRIVVVPWNENDKLFEMSDISEHWQQYDPALDQMVD